MTCRPSPDRQYCAIPVRDLYAAGDWADWLDTAAATLNQFATERDTAHNLARCARFLRNLGIPTDTYLELEHNNAARQTNNGGRPNRLTTT